MLCVLAKAGTHGLWRRNACIKMDFRLRENDKALKSMTVVLRKHEVLAKLW